MWPRLPVAEICNLGACLVSSVDCSSGGGFYPITILLLSFFLCYGFLANICGILAPQPGIKPTPPALEGGVLTPGPPGKSLAEALMYVFK